MPSIQIYNVTYSLSDLTEDATLVCSPLRNISCYHKPHSSPIPSVISHALTNPPHLRPLADITSTGAFRGPRGQTQITAALPAKTAISDGHTDTYADRIEGEEGEGGERRRKGWILISETYMCC
jgi:hypothetical protein